MIKLTQSQLDSLQAIEHRMPRNTINSYDIEWLVDNGLACWEYSNYGVVVTGGGVEVLDKLVG